MEEVALDDVGVDALHRVALVIAAGKRTQSIPGASGIEADVVRSGGLMRVWDLLDREAFAETREHRLVLHSDIAHQPVVRGQRHAGHREEDAQEVLAVEHRGGGAAMVAVGDVGFRFGGRQCDKTRLGGGVVDEPDVVAAPAVVVGCVVRRPT